MSIKISKPTAYRYGFSPIPKSWHDTAQIIESMYPKNKNGSKLMERLDAIEKHLKEKK